jgi:hypothetical protein
MEQEPTAVLMLQKRESHMLWRCGHKRGERQDGWMRVKVLRVWVLRSN